MNDKAIEAAAESIRKCLEAIGAEAGPNTCYAIAQDAIAAYEAAMWRPAAECRDGREYVARYIKQGNVSRIVRWSDFRKCWMSKGEVIPNFEAQDTLLVPLPAAPESEDTPND